MSRLYGTLTDGSIAPVRINSDGGLVTTGSEGSGGSSNPATTATRTSVTAAATNTLLLAASTTRKGASVYNDATTDLYLAVGSAAASTTSFTVKLVPGAFYELLPAWSQLEIRGIWAGSPSGAARITEVS
jgi:hypothetical protein